MKQYEGYEPQSEKPMCFGAGFDILNPRRCDGCEYFEDCKEKSMKLRYPDPK